MKSPPSVVYPARRLLSAVGCLVAVLLGAEGSWAQDQGVEAPPGSVVVPGESGDVVVTPGETSTSHTYTPPPGTPQPGTDINEGLPTSSQPTMNTAAAGDSFDLAPSRSGSRVVRGQEGSTALLPSDRQRRPVQVPDIHTVEKGDTLWDLCAYYFNNPWKWPKLWSFNPQIENPHWIYPGDQVRMRGRGRGASRGRGGLTGARDGAGAGGEGLINRRQARPEDTVFLRSQGFIDDPERDQWGELIGAREDQMLLSQGNHVYLKMRPGNDVDPGDTLTVYRPVRQPRDVPGARQPPGEIVAVKGTVRVDQYDPESRIARGEITESVDVIERGSKVGPVGRRFHVVPPRTNEVEVWARVLTSVYPHVYMGQNQVVFIDRGTEDGLQAGNRLFVVRKGDTWRRTLRSSTKVARERMRTGVPEDVEVETTPLKGDEERFPEEIIATLRVLQAKKFSSVCLVTMSHREIVPGDRAVARQGY